ncbi:glutathione S-transferase P-like [Sycon ciliatum]|uniref:glutathione S-transferase P-like n=1 Tax=Sycon ciliatum TaxID=27933 RepID=UPI0031F6C496|eukprot:scpid32396/ scgid29298/ Glutathione S-transferase P; GST P1-1; GST class-pi
MDLLPVLFVGLLGVAAYFHTTNPHMVQSVRHIATGKPGCLPLESIGNVTFHYFAGRGRGEHIRLLMEDGGISYTETHYTRETWPAAKEQGLKSGLYTFGQVPAIETTSGLRLAQSTAILRHLSRASGYDCDCDDYSWCDVLALGVEDQTTKMGRVVWAADLDAEKRRTYLKEARTWIAYYEQHAPAGEPAANRGYFTSGGRITWVDFAIFNFLDAHKAFAEVAMEGDKSPADNFMAEFPRLSAFYQRFSQRPQVAAYLASERRHPYSLPKKS